MRAEGRNAGLAGPLPACRVDRLRAEGRATGFTPPGLDQERTRSLAPDREPSIESLSRSVVQVREPIFRALSVPDAKLSGVGPVVREIKGYGLGPPP